MNLLFLTNEISCCLIAAASIFFCIRLARIFLLEKRLERKIPPRGKEGFFSTLSNFLCPKAHQWSSQNAKQLKSKSYRLPLTLPDNEQKKTNIKPSFVKPIIQNGWNNPTIPVLPSIHSFEQSDCILDCCFHDPMIVLENLANSFRLLSLWVKYHPNPAGAALLSLEQVELYVYLWKTDTSGQNLCVEIQQRRGNSDTFYQYARHIFMAALGNLDPLSISVRNDVQVDEQYWKKAETLTKEWTSQESNCKKNSDQTMDDILTCFLEKNLGSRILGMERLCILSNVMNTSMREAFEISRCILFREGEGHLGKFHDFILYAIQKQCMPDEEAILADFDLLNEDDDDEEYFAIQDRNADKPLEYQKAMRFFMTYGLVIVSNCLEVLRFVTTTTTTTSLSCPVEYENYASKVLQTAQEHTQKDLLNSLLEILDKANDQPHNATEAAKCLKLLCHLSPETRKQLCKRNAASIVQNAQQIGLTMHRKLEQESTELLQIVRGF
jgi:hypothetical protein